MESCPECSGIKLENGDQWHTLLCCSKPPINEAKIAVGIEDTMLLFDASLFGKSVAELGQSAR